MHLRWPLQEYKRTCRDCGHIWRVPRQFAHKQMLSIPGVVGGSRLPMSDINPYAGPAAGDINASLRIGQESDAYRTCPECRSRHYSQHLVWF